MSSGALNQPIRPMPAMGFAFKGYTSKAGSS